MGGERGMAGPVLLLGKQAVVRAETVRIAVGEWPPYISESLPNQGREVVRQAFAEEGLDVSFHFYSWAEAYRLTPEGRYVVTVSGFAPASGSSFSISPPRSAISTTRLMTLTGTPAVNLGELKHEPVGVTRGYFYGDGFAARQAGLTSSGQIPMRRAWASCSTGGSTIW